MSSSNDIRIEWVMRDGTLVPVSSFGTLPRGRRPEVRCPECRETVTLKLGPKRRHHAAHRPGSVCAGATNPETALHINVKCHIADELRRAIGSGVELRTRRGCIGARPVYPSGSGVLDKPRSGGCDRSADQVWITAWDDVQIEFTVGGTSGARRPDIVLLRQGRPVGAIEVVVSHRVDEVKAEMLAALDVPWVEIAATETLYQQPRAWAATDPLRPDRASFPVAWRCETHADEFDRTETARQRAATRVAEGLAGGTTIEALRVADVYRRDGAAIRVMYRVIGVTNDGVLRRLSLERQGRTLSAYLAEDGEEATAFRSRVSADVNRDYERDLAGYRKHGAFTDSPMRWARSAAAAAGADPRRFPQRYRFHPGSMAWEIVPRLEKATWPVAPDAVSLRESVEIALRGTKRGPQTALRSRDD